MPVLRVRSLGALVPGVLCASLDAGLQRAPLAGVISVLSNCLIRILMNIIHLHGHDAGRMFAPYGYNTPTPCLQAFAEAGITFRQAFCAAPTCSPSRAALLTGRYPHACGMHGLASIPAYFALNDYSQHLASFLNRHGYTTAVSGVMHEGRAPLTDLSEVGYDHWLNHNREGVPDKNRTLGAALEFLGTVGEAPFFLSCGFGEPHRDNPNKGRRHGYDADMPFLEELDGRYTRPPAPIPDTPLTRQDWASFCDGVGRLDAKMGAVIDAVDRFGLADNTLIIATIDHGIAWPHGKGNLTDMGTGVMLIMRGSKGSGFEGGRVNDALVSHIDIYPTLCDLLDIEKPDWLHGTSMLPLIDGNAETIRDHVFVEQGWHGWGYDPQRGIRTERYKYIRRKDVRHQRIIDPGPTNDWMGSLGYRDWPAGNELLYDLWFDPCETNNLAASPDHANILANLSARVDQWMADTRDPFVDDSIPKPIDGTKTEQDTARRESNR